MRDSDIRSALLARDLATYSADPDSLLIPELGICQGDFRVDLAVVNGALHGWEIKSDRDTLARLPAQARAYSAVFDFMTLVVGRVHLERALDLVPAWWGVRLALPARGEAVQLTTHRRGGRNPAAEPRQVVELLWKEEAIEVLEDHGGARGFRACTRRELWDELVRRLDQESLGRMVRERIKARQDWRRRAAP